MLAKTPAEKEEIRHAVRSYLYSRLLAAQPVATIGRNLRKDGNRCDDEDVEMAAAFLVGMEQAESISDGLGSTEYYKLSPAGILDHERSGALA